MRPAALRAVIATASVAVIIPVALPIARARVAPPDRPMVDVVISLTDTSRETLLDREAAAVVEATAADLTADVGGRLGVVWSAGLHGFAARVPVSAIAVLKRDPRVSAVEPDQVISLAAASPPWGLDRIDQQHLPLDRAYQPDGSGTGVTAYVIDTGIRTTHTDFGRRARTGVDLVDGGEADDCNGHGTHVAGIIGGERHGVAREVNLVAVRVMDCSGRATTARVISGIEWVTEHRVAGTSAVANLSLGGAPSAVLDEAVRRSIDSGITYTIAAGNGAADGSPEDACNSSPARVRQALTVSATTRDDARAPWAGFGSCVDLFAPGVAIVSAWVSTDTATKSLSGTSMAAPHVAGVVAVYLQNHPAADPNEIAVALHDLAAQGVVTNSMTRTPLLVQVERRS